MHTMYISNYDTIMLTYAGMSVLFAHGVMPAHLPYTVCYTYHTIILCTFSQVIKLHASMACNKLINYCSIRE